MTHGESGKEDHGGSEREEAGGGGAESFLRGDLSSNLNFFLFYANH